MPEPPVTPPETSSASRSAAAGGDPAGAALALLRLYAEWGVDEALDTDPVDRRRAPVPVVPRVRDSVLRAMRPDPPPIAAGAIGPMIPASQAPPGGQAARAAGLAEAATDLDALHAAMAAFGEFGLRGAATHTVPAVVGSRARFIVLGDYADADEDRSGQPFAGEAGAVLDRMLAAIGHTRDDCALLPAIAWRPPGGRPPTPSEIATCTPFLRQGVALIAAGLRARSGRMPPVLALGRLGPRMLGAPVGDRSRGIPNWVEVALPTDTLPSGELRMLPLPHPTALLAQPNLRRTAWHGLLRFALGLEKEGEAGR